MGKTITCLSNLHLLKILFKYKGVQINIPNLPIACSFFLRATKEKGDSCEIVKTEQIK